MSRFPSSNYSVPIEEYPGVVGYIWDAEPRFLVGLEVLGRVDWRRLWEALDAADEARTLTLRCCGRDLLLSVAEYRETGGLALLLEQLPAIEFVLATPVPAMPGLLLDLATFSASRTW